MSSLLYQDIAESIRQAILYGELAPGDELPPVRAMAKQWNCAPGTVQRAYKELARQGLVGGRPGQGTRVTHALTSQSDISASHRASSLRRAALTNDAEAFLLRLLASGYSTDEIEQAFHLALDRWRAAARPALPKSSEGLRFVGSHDPAITLIVDHLKQIQPLYALRIAFSGSLGGLIALAEHTAEMAGCHLWDQETDTYNIAFIRRLLPGQRTALLTLAHRRLGLMVAPGNPDHIASLSDLTRPNVRFINRQPGAGTRVWLDTQLSQAQIESRRIAGYDDQVMTHTDIASAIASGRATVGLGIETVARAYGLDFVFLTSERYDLVIPETAWEAAPVQYLVAWLAAAEARALLTDLGGYDVRETGKLTWLP